MRIKKENIKPFIFGCISMLVVVSVVFGGIQLYNNYKHNKGINKQNDVTNNEGKDNDMTYKKVYEKDNDIVCDTYKDMWYYDDYGDSGAYLVTNDGSIYILNEKKYSDTNQNCKLYDENIKIKTIINDREFISSDNKVYTIINRGNTLLVEENAYGNQYPNELINDNIKYIYSYNYNIDKENNIEYDEYIVLKEDGKLYKMKFFHNTMGEKNYKLESDEVFQEFDGEKIKRFYITSKIKPINGLIDYIITDKNIYLKVPINKECLEYADIECKYEYKASKYLQKYVNSLVDIILEDYGNGHGFYHITTYDKMLNVDVTEN